MRDTQCHRAAADEIDQMQSRHLGCGREIDNRHDIMVHNARAMARESRPCAFKEAVTDSLSYRGQRFGGNRLTADHGKCRTQRPADCDCRPGTQK